MKNTEKKRVKVLLIEDNPVYVRLIQEMLATARTINFELQEAYRLSTGLALLASSEVDVILLDLSLPDSYGYDTFVKVYKQAEDRPIVVLTNLDNEELAAKSLAAGAQDYLVKGELNHNLLIRVLLYAIERQQLLAKSVAEHLRQRQFSESRFELIVDSTADGIVVVDRQGQVRFANKAIEKIFGRKSEELVDQVFGFPVVSGETTELNVPLGEGKSSTVEMRVVESEWEGEPALLASLRDVTERKQAEEDSRVHAEQQAVVAQLGQRALLETNLTDLLNHTVRLVAQTCQVEYCRVLEFMPDTNLACLRAGFGWLPAADGEEPVLELGGNSEFEYMLQTRSPLIIEDLNTETRFEGSAWLRQHGAVSGMETLIQGQSQAFGILSVYSKKRRTFNQSDVNFLQAIANVLAAAVERIEKEKALRFQTSLLEAQRETSLDGVLITLNEGQWLSFNRRFVEMWNIPAEAIQSRNREAALRTIRNQVVDPEQLAADIDYLYEHAHETERKEVILKDGRILERYSAPVKSTEGEYYGRVWYFRDITDRKLAEEQLRASLREKEVLLREVHHRVKNNLQAISNLLYLQSEHIGSSQILAIFRETQDRVKSIALIHEKLYQSRDLSQIDFAEYVDSLATHLIHSYGRDRAVSLEVQVDDISIDVDAAIPLGVIINELVTNSLKHAFPAEKKGPDDPSNRVCIELRQGSGRVLVLTVGDNGVGFPPEMDISTTRSLGLQLVNTLSTHMKGTVDLKQNGGAVVKISFELPHRPKAV